MDTDGPMESDGYGKLWDDKSFVPSVVRFGMPQFGMLVSSLILFRSEEYRGHRHGGFQGASRDREVGGIRKLLLE